MKGQSKMDRVVQATEDFHFEYHRQVQLWLAEIVDEGLKAWLVLKLDQTGDS